MVKLELFIVEKRLPTFGALAVLSLSDLLFAGSQVFGFGGLSLRPVILETWVIGRCVALDQGVPFNREPTKLEQIGSCLLVPKRPAVPSLQIELSPILLFEPIDGLGGMSLFGVPECFVKHPSIQIPKDFFCHPDAEVVRPPSNDGVESGHHGQGVGPFASVPFFL
jgi:hypothetical protein